MAGFLEDLGVAQQHVQDFRIVDQHIAHGGPLLGRKGRGLNLGQGRQRQQQDKRNGEDTERRHGKILWVKLPDYAARPWPEQATSP